jgi:hypothetical protein
MIIDEISNIMFFFKHRAICFFELTHLMISPMKSFYFATLLKKVSGCKSRKHLNVLRVSVLDCATNCIVSNTFDEDLILIFMCF